MSVFGKIKSFQTIFQNSFDYNAEVANDKDLFVASVSKLTSTKNIITEHNMFHIYFHPLVFIWDKLKLQWPLGDTPQSIESIINHAIRRKTPFSKGNKYV